MVLLSHSSVNLQNETGDWVYLNHVLFLSSHQENFKQMWSIESELCVSQIPNFSKEAVKTAQYC